MLGDTCGPAQRHSAGGLIWGSHKNPWSPVSSVPASMCWSHALIESLDKEHVSPLGNLGGINLYS